MSGKRSVIGRSCMSVALDLGGASIARYNPRNTGPQIYAPYIVGPNASFWDMQMWTGNGPAPMVVVEGQESSRLAFAS